MSIASKETSTDHPVDRDFVADYTVERDKGPMVGGDNAFKVAIFGANVSTGQGGLNFAENSIKLGNWGEVQHLAQKADRYGVDGFIPIARWQGLAGPDRPWGRQFETFTWAAGLAAVTQNIQIIATCNVQFMNPVMGAKMVTTIDHISGGRMGLNVTAGYFKPEYDIFGVDLPEHDVRYELADEWIEIAERLWGNEEQEFDFDGKFFNLKGAQAHPKPVQSPRPMVMSAGSSPAGQEFAFKHANVLFASVASVEHSGELTPKIRQKADAAGREDLGLWAGAHIIVKDTEKEARAYADYVTESTDWESALRYREIIRTGTQSFNWDEYKQSEDYKRDESVRAFGRAALMPITGTPEMVVEELQKLQASGITGICTGLVDYDEGLDRLNEQIFPLMREAGLRA
jgi:dimethylsulfone monooxygenase